VFSVVVAIVAITRVMFVASCMFAMAVILGGGQRSRRERECNYRDKQSLQNPAHAFSSGGLETLVHGT
jgi:hypothetical protein